MKIKLKKVAAGDGGYFYFNVLQLNFGDFLKASVSDYQMECKHCSSACIKVGKQANGNQKYRCKSCFKYQQKRYRYNACLIQDRRSYFIKLHNEGNGIRGLSRILNISCNTVMKWKINYATDISSPVYHAHNHTYEIDELCSYIKHKRSQIWVMYIFDTTLKKVVDFKVGSRTKENLKTLIDQVLNKSPKRIGTDGLSSYRTLIPSELHKVGLRYTRHIERNNLNLRIHLKYLARKTICYSKSTKMLEASLKLYFWGG